MHSGDGDAVDGGGVLRMEVADVVDADAAARALASPSHGDVHGSATPAPPEVVQSRRIAMAQHRARTARQHRRHPQPALRQLAMADRVDAAVDDVEATGRDGALDRARAVSHRDQLPVRDHGMLAIREPGERHVTWTTLTSNSDLNVVHVTPALRNPGHIP